MANIGELSVGIKYDEKSLKKTTKNMKKELSDTGDNIEKSFEKNTKNINSSFKKLSGIIAGVFTIEAIKKFSTALFGLGSDLTEISSKFDVVFKSNQEVTESFNNLADTTNRSRLDLLEFGSGVGNVLSPLGLAQEDVNGLSLSLTQLAIDVASFNNVSDSQAINAFTSALTGEREALKSLGIVINDTDVKNKAYNLGLAEQGATLTKAQQALATYQLLLDNTSNAQGDAVRTADSFANQLKGLRGAIKDIFAESGLEVANQTAGILKQLTVFVGAYGKAIISSITLLLTTVASAVGDIVKIFGILNNAVTKGGEDTQSSIESSTNGFLKFIGYLSAGIKTISVTLVTLGRLVGNIVGTIANYFINGKDTIINTFSIILNTGIGTFKSLVDVVEFAVKQITNTIGLIGKSIAGIFTGKTIDIGAEIQKLKEEFGNLGNDISKNFSNAGENFINLGNTINEVGEKNRKNQNKTLKEIKNDWIGLFETIEKNNNNLDKNLKEGAEKSSDSLEKYEQGYYNILDLIDKYKGGLDSTIETTEDLADESIDAIETLYDEWKGNISDLEKAQEKLAENTKKYNDEITDSIRETGNELKTLSSDYKNAIATIKLEESQDLSTRNVAINEELLDIEKEIAEIKADTITDEEDKIKNQETLNGLEKQKLALLKEQDFIINNTTETQRAEAERLAGLSEAEKIKEDAQTQIEAKNQEFEEEKRKLENIQKINEFFLKIKKVNQEDLNKFLSDSRLAELSQEEQALIIKLAREKIELTTQKDTIISLQQEISDKSIELSNSASAVQLANLTSIKSSYAELIEQIQTAIQQQRRLNALSGNTTTNSTGFADGGYTGAGGTHDVAGVVHKGEWVAPKWMVNNMKDVFSNLEKTRVKGYSNGGNTTNNNKTQTNNITVNSGIDLKGFIDYAKWKL